MYNILVRSGSDRRPSSSGARAACTRVQLLELLQKYTIPELESEEVRELGEDKHITLEQFVTLFYKLKTMCAFYSDPYDACRSKKRLTHVVFTAFEDHRYLDLDELLLGSNLRH